jgi:hypothetical protein
MEPPVLMEPPAGRVGDVRRPIVEHQVHRKIGGDTRVELVQEGDEGRGGVAVQAGGLEGPAAVHVQRSQQGRGAVADVLVLLAGRAAGGNWLGRPGAAAGTDPGLLIHTEHQRVSRWHQVQPADISRAFPDGGVIRRVIQLRTRCGLMSRSARIRPIWEAEMPRSASASASWRWLQWLAGSGGSWVTVATIRSRLSWS